MSKTGSLKGRNYGCASRNDRKRKGGGKNGKALAGWKRKEMGTSGPKKTCSACGCGMGNQKRCPTCGAAA